MIKAIRLSLFLYSCKTCRRIDKQCATANPDEWNPVCNDLQRAFAIITIFLFFFFFAFGLERSTFSFALYIRGFLSNTSKLACGAQEKIISVILRQSREYVSILAGLLSHFRNHLVLFKLQLFFNIVFRDSEACYLAYYLSAQRKV